MPKSNVKCLICGNAFYAKPNWIKIGHGKYCSIICKREAQKTGKFVKCFICNKEVYKTRAALQHSKSKKYFCDKSCQTKWRNSFLYIGPNHFNWKGGNYAYKSVLNRHKVPKICGLCKTKDARVLAVHHVDKNHKNNKLNNLIWLCHNCHFLVHRYNVECN